MEDLGIKVDAEFEFNKGISHKVFFQGKPMKVTVTEKPNSNGSICRRIVIPVDVRRYLPLDEDDNGKEKRIIYFTPCDEEGVIGKLVHPEVYQRKANLALAIGENSFFSRYIRLNLGDQGRTTSQLSDYLENVKNVVFIPKGEYVEIKKENN